MPKYSNTPPAQTSGPSLPIMRTPAGAKLRAIITSHDITGTDTHFWGGHTVPCTEGVCPACGKGVPFRWHGYLTAFQPTKGLHFLYEMTAIAADIVCAFRKEHPDLRGYEFEAYRWHSNPRGRIMLRMNPTKNEAHPLPAAPDLQAVLAILWQLPKDNVQTTPGRDVAARLAVDLHVPGQNEPPNPQEGEYGEAV